MGRHERETALAQAIIGAEIDLWGRIEHELKECGSRLNAARFFLLHAIEEEPRTLTDVARRVKATAPAASRLVDRMIASDLVNKIENPADRRSSLLVVTKKGGAALSHAKPAVQAALSHSFAGMDTHMLELLSIQLSAVAATAATPSAARGTKENALVKTDETDAVCKEEQ